MRLDLDTLCHLLRYYKRTARGTEHVPNGTPGAHLEHSAACGKAMGNAKNHRRGATTSKLSRVTCAACKAAVVEERLERAR